MASRPGGRDGSRVGHVHQPPLHRAGQHADRRLQPDLRLQQQHREPARPDQINQNNYYGYGPIPGSATRPHPRAATSRTHDPALPGQHGRPGRLQLHAGRSLLGRLLGPGLHGRHADEPARPLPRRPGQLQRSPGRHPDALYFGLIPLNRDSLTTTAAAGNTAVSASERRRRHPHPAQPDGDRVPSMTPVNSAISNPPTTPLTPPPPPTNYFYVVGSSPAPTGGGTKRVRSIRSRSAPRALPP